MDDRLIAYDRIPPQSLDMEQATLGAMLIERRAIEKATAILRPEDFYRDAHRTVFEAILALTERNEPVDLLTVQEQLRNQEALESVGGVPYLFQLTDSLPTAANVEHYAKAVGEKAILRRLIEAGNAIQALGHSEYSDITELQQRAECLVMACAREKADGAGLAPAADGIDALWDDISRRVVARQEGRPIMGAPSGLDDLDFMTNGFQRSDLIVVGARPSEGKTSLACNVALAAARAEWPTAIFSLEMSRSQLQLRLVGDMASVPASSIRSGTLSASDMIAVKAATERLREMPVWIDASPTVTVAQMLARIRRQKAARRAKLIIVDYLQIVRPRRQSDNRTQEVGEISRDLKAMARELNVPVLALCQLNRQVEGRADRKPQLSDLRESGSVEAEADLVIFIHRPDRGKRLAHERITLILAKQRNGPIGEVPVSFREDLMRFGECRDAEAEEKLPAQLPRGGYPEAQAVVLANGNGHVDEFFTGTLAADPFAED